MPSPITAKHLHHIVDIIRDWPKDESLTWDNICNASEVVIGYKPTRQALSKKAILTNAYKTKKGELKAKRLAVAGVPTPKSMPAAIEQISRLKQENIQLRQELTRMAETAQRFIHNASLHGLTPAHLMKQLPKQNRKE
ncbi:hypothetical protein [Aeromonas tecta]|uniref:hypothetical protein n=1 Tax=Aeromonas tecta TaxID=324617 RepID=UPI0012FB9179|nr:hypothetical protein [Aeromonas tecta]HEH9397840.1 hypothetical protein [Aeromonas salmonicida]